MAPSLSFRATFTDSLVGLQIGSKGMDWGNNWWEDSYNSALQAGSKKRKKSKNSLQKMKKAKTSSDSDSDSYRSQQEGVAS